MRRLERIPELRAVLRDGRRRGARVALVPTMGYLHEGHLRLVDLARERADLTVMSVFVNPLQFGPGEDLARYPRDPEGDAAKAGSRGVDLFFIPEPAEMYRGDRAVSVTPLALADRWEGAIRPGHFAGVLTVVAKLFNIVQPDVAVFGQKDIQQATLVRAMVRDLDFPLDVVVGSTVREPDGLALSSRNAYLGPAERRRATVLSRALFAVRDLYAAGERDAGSLLAAGHAVLREEPEVRLDYLALMDPEGLEPVGRAGAGVIGAGAVRVGPTRLIDNVILGGE